MDSQGESIGAAEVIAEPRAIYRDIRSLHAPNEGSVPAGATAPKPPYLDVSAVICTYTEDRWDELVAAVESLRRQRHTPREILVVVDYNPPLFERVRAGITGVLALQNAYEQGLSGGRNTALDAASAPLVSFLDDDAEADDGWLQTLTAHFTDSQVVAVGSRVNGVWATGRPRWFPVEFDWVVGCTYEGTPTSLVPVRNTFGGAMALRRDALAIAGGYRCDLGRIGKHPLGCEETELCIRLRRLCRGSVILYDPSTHIRHHVPHERTTWRYFRRRCYGEGLSKAIVRATAGTADSLATEHNYVLKTLPMGLRREFMTAVHGDVAGGLSRAGAIVVGLAWTVGGYAMGRMRSRRWTLHSGASAPGAPTNWKARRSDEPAV